MAEIGSLAVRLGLDNKDFKRGLAESKNELGGFKNNLTNIAAAVGVAFGVNELVNFSKELYLLNEIAYGVTKTFNNFQNSKRLMDDLKTATGNTVGELKLMQLAINAKNFNIPIEELGTMLKFATIRAAETGQSVDYLVESIITGIGRKSVMILDNLGISAIAVQEEFKKTGDFAKAVGNIIDRDMVKSVLSIDEAANSSAKLAAQWEDFKLFLSDFTKEEGNDFLNFLSESLIGIKNLIVLFDSLNTRKEQAAPLSGFTYGGAAGAGAGAGKVGKIMGGEAAEPLGLIETLELKLKDLEEAKKKAFSVEEIAKINVELRKTEKELANIKASMVAVDMPSVSKTGIDQISGGEVGLPGIDPSRMQTFNAELLNTRSITGELIQTWDDLGNVFINTGRLMQELGTEVFAGFAEDLGNALTGSTDFGQGILKSMSGFMSSFGKQLVAIGLGKIALDKLFMVPGGGAIAVAAGVALMTAAQVLNNTAAQAVSSIGVGGGSFSSGGGSTRGLRQRDEQVIRIEGVVDGRVIRWVNAKDSYRRSRGG